MKKNTILILNFFILIVLLTGCSKISSNILTTDLSAIFIDDLSIGSSIERINLNQYTESERHSGNYTYRFDELVINIDNNKINYLFSRFDENKTVISVNGQTDLTNIDTVSDILGNNFKEKWKDKEQQLMVHIYYDHTNNTEVQFVYSKYDNSLVWITMSQIDN
ncbi:hypothetical protein FDC58_00735 [Clostridium botulinum]|uniref:hypothetical protein n=1 Tax=unclassified Clostridium TaxID=2614128 RepID=UPI0005023276|nr:MULTISPECIES: hypothetical protein [unclassified Clostridium]AIY80465.1 peptidase M56, BlaR1 domain protein [Clostridium botulinum 202F]KAI3347624.1 hypothetical protein CIT17_05065 [Clostridium botulinum]KFX59578.1 hypothetical protein KU40_00925 [Clostridium botulinum]KON14383.1 hypothetical protein ACP50_02375 [Clostridium botulinum]MBY6779331.1 hypothetical protein [Clostridium botulinum]